MGSLKVTPEGMPSISVDGQEYPLFFSVLGVQRWAEYRGIDFEGVVSVLLAPFEHGLDGLRALLRIGLSGGEIRRCMVAGGSAREIGDEIIERILSVYHLLEVSDVIQAAWTLTDPSEPKQANPPTPDNTEDSHGAALSGSRPSAATE